MGAGGTERIALLFETRADLAGAKAVREETTAIGQAAKAATETAAAGETKLAASIEQVRVARERSNGDFEKFKTELAAIVRGEDALAAAASRAAAELAKQAAAARAVAGAPRSTPVLAGPTGPQLGPALPGTPAGGGVSRQNALAEMAAYRMEAERTATTLAKIPPQARQVGNAINLAASSAALGTGSLTGLAAAAGNVAQGMSIMSTNAKFAASAAGIGALAAAVAVLIGLAIEAKRKLQEIPDGAINAGTAERIQNLRTVAAVEQQIALTRAQADAARSSVGRFAGRDENAAKLKLSADLNAKAEALEKRAVEIRREVAEKGRDDREKALSDEKQQRDRQMALNEAADKQLLQLTNSSYDMAERLSFTAQEAGRRRIERESADREREIGLLKVDEDRKTALLVASRRERDDQLRALDDQIAQKRAQASGELGSLGGLVERTNSRIAEIERERDASIKAGVDGVTAAEIAERKKRALYRQTAVAAAADAKTLVDVLLASGSQQVRAVGHAADAVRRVLIGAQAAHAAVEAAIEGGKALGSAASGDLRGAALHGAAALQLAAAAALGAQEALGGGRGASAAGGGGGGVGDQGTFQPRDGNGGGGQTIVIQTIDPYSPGKIAEVAYHLGRGQILKRPIPIAPTLGLARTG